MISFIRPFAGPQGTLSRRCPWDNTSDNQPPVGCLQQPPGRIRSESNSCRLRRCGIDDSAAGIPSLDRRSLLVTTGTHALAVLNSIPPSACHPLCERRQTAATNTANGVRFYVYASCLSRHHNMAPAITVYWISLLITCVQRTKMTIYPTLTRRASGLSSPVSPGYHHPTAVHLTLWPR